MSEGNSNGNDPDYIITKAWNLLFSNFDLAGMTIPTGTPHTFNFDAALVNITNWTNDTPEPFNGSNTSGGGRGDYAPSGSGGGAGSVSWGGNGSTVNGSGLASGLSLDGRPVKATGDFGEKDFTIANLESVPQPDFETNKATLTVPTPAYTAPNLSFPQIEGLSDFGEADLDFPTIPEITAEVRDTFKPINLDPFVPIEFDFASDPLPTFDLGAMPPIEVPDLFIYAEDMSLLGDLTSAMNTGNVVPLTPLINAKTEDLRRELLREEHLVRRESAERGFFMATGDVTNKLLLLNQKYLGEVKKASEEVREEVGKRALDTISTAGESALTLEAKHLAIHLAYIEHLVAIRKISVKMLIALHNQAAQMVNMKLALLKPHIEVYKSYVQAVSTQNEAAIKVTKKLSAFTSSQRAEVEEYTAQKETEAKGAEADALKYKEDVHKWREYALQLRNVKQNIERMKTNVESLNTAIKAFEQSAEYDSAAAKANRAALESWASEWQVRAANYAASGQFYAAEAERTNLYAGQLRTASQAFRQANTAYQSYISAQQSYISALSDKLDVITRAGTAFNAYNDASMRYVSAWNRAEGTRVSAVNQYELVEADRALRAQILDASEASYEAAITVGKLAAQADTASSVAEAAYSTYGGSLRMSGSVQMGSQAQTNSTESTVTQGDESYSLNTQYLS